MTAVIRKTLRQQCAARLARPLPCGTAFRVANADFVHAA